MALIWILATAVFYLSLTLIYGNFTWYFIIPTVLLGLISGFYLAQTLYIMRKVENNRDDIPQLTFRFNIMIGIICIILIIWFERIILNNFLTTLLSGCIWFPQIIKNAHEQSKGTPKLRHAFLLQLSVSLIVFYIRFNATSIFRLKPQDSFVVFYFCLVSFQLFCLFVQKYWSPRLVIPDQYRDMWFIAK